MFAPMAPAPKSVEGRGPRRVARSLSHRGRPKARRAWHATTAAVRRALIGLASAPPAPGSEVGAERRVTILLFSAWGMGGTIRATHNLAAYLAARGYAIEILSVMRRRDEPFFGDFPPGVKVTALDDQRPHVRPRGITGLSRGLLGSLPSVLVHPAERWAGDFSLWSDIRLVRELRGRSGFLIGTRPGLNLIAAQLAPPGMVLIGEEQMHLRHHSRPLRKAMRRLYPRLDAFAVLTDGTLEDYRRHLSGRVRLERIPNTVRDLGERTADLDSKLVLAAGRFVAQKGFDYLIPAFAQVATAHPDWRLRICGRGKLRERLKGMIADHGLSDVVELAPPAEDMAAELEGAAIFAMSSRFEGFPLMLLEAMSKGTAVVSFDCPTGPADIIDNRRNGILVPPRDPDALGRGLVEMIEDHELRRRCGAAAVETARDYTIEAVGPRWERLFAGLWAERTAGASAPPPAEAATQDGARSRVAPAGAAST
jgi:glycosyltransferase involved in cell wall biosynthesis